MSEKILKWLLRLYPRRFRNEYGDAMRQLVRDRMSAETGILARLRLWMDLLRDLVISVPREHRRRPQLAVVECVGYRMSEKAVAEMVKRSHVRQLPPAFLSIALGAMLGWMGQAPRWPLCAVYGPLMFFAASSLRGLGRWKDQWRSYELVLEEDRIQQIEHGGVKLTLLKTEVTRLLETRDLGIAIQTLDPRRSIWVPSVLNGYEELRARLAAWVPVEEPPRDNRHLSIHGHRPVQWIFAFYPAALLVRSPDFAIPLTALLTAYLLNLARDLSRPTTLTDGTEWKVSPAARLAPLALIVPLIVKLVLVLR